MTPHEKYKALLNSPIIEGNNLDVIRKLKSDGLSRVGIGIDSNPQAVEVSRRRIAGS
jgi:MoaA/NifB/PqqE/SkfB family radical SAM enzyme